ncbi:DUF1275 domain-containing protein [Actinomadura sp. ATCC 31491]|uniref:DUF1275 domain-containing protein n=1 Tax=Actinomadura luzonensis TaxID=2805427 RepID=A0ABT0FTX9_9ACTN|nr:DUF1275 family protein [Actinomadura luzonensis]MCK2215767.1 DUF1275 domain-containing protein [Actinomadura luzonensis]
MKVTVAGPRRRRAGLPLTTLAVVLTLGTGALDVAALARLGGVFSSVMTGNLVVTGLAAGTAAPGQLATAATALAGYVTGVLTGTLLTGRVPLKPKGARGVLVALAAELVVLAAFAAGWEAAGGRPAGGALHVLLALASGAMGVQSAAVRALAGHGAVSTTYLTGTLTGVVAALVTLGRPRGARARDLAVLAAVVAGAGGGALLIAYAPAALPAVPLTAVLAAGALTALRGAG